jgi:hypothetical protein
VTFRYVAIGGERGTAYATIHQDGAPDGREGVTLIEPFAVEPERDEAFETAWRARRATVATQRGYLGTRLHRSVGPAQLRYVHVARWSSPLMFAKAHAGAAELPFPSHPALYLVV